MKNTLLKITTVFFLGMAIISCTPEDGKDGATGTANVITTSWVQRDFRGSGSSFNCSAENIPQFITSIIESGTILSYKKTNVDGTIQPVPLQVETAYIQMAYRSGGFVAYSNFDASAEYRHIIIPSPSVAGRGVSQNDYSKMSYHEICTMFNINE